MLPRVRVSTNLVPRAMPVRGLGWHCLWGNGINFAISLAAVRSIDARPVHAIPCRIFAGVNGRKQIYRGNLSSLFE